MQIPMGTQLTLHARANKELVQVQIDSPTEQKPPRGPQILTANDLASDRRGFSYVLPPLMEDTTVLLTLTDSDEIANREPVRLSLVAIPDMAPQLAVRLLGIGTAVTPQARLPVSGRITDDYGIARLWFEYTVDRQAPKVAEEVALPRHPTDWPLTEKALELRGLNLKAGQKLLVALKAADLCDLPPKKTPNVGTSERWLLDVVTPDQLRTMLEAREAVLRWRFKSIVDEVTQTRDVLLRTRFGQTAGKGKAEKKASGAAGGTSAWQPPAWVPLLACPAVPAMHGWTSHPWHPEDGFVAAGDPTARRSSSYPEGAEPGEEAESLPELSAQQQLDLQNSLLQLAVQTGRKNAQETAGVADGFDDIRLQLVNNRIDSEALRLRLGAGIIQPLHKIVEQMFPEFEAPAGGPGGGGCRSQPRLGVPGIGPCGPKTGRRHPPGDAGGSQPHAGDVRLQPNGGAASQPDQATRNRSSNIPKSDRRVASASYWRNRHGRAETICCRVLLGRADCPVLGGGTGAEEQSDGASTAAGSSGKPAAKAEPPSTEKLAGDQQRVGESFKRLEESLLHVGEVNAAADPRRAALLKKVVEESKKREIDLQFTGTVDLLQKDQLSRAWKTRRNSSKTCRPSCNSCKAKTRRTASPRRRNALANTSSSSPASLSSSRASRERSTAAAT